MGKRYGVGREGQPSGKTGAAGRDFYVSQGRAAKARREAANRTRPSSSGTPRQPKKPESSGGLFGWFKK